jgi:DNA polymerase elongation subunit (family B)
MFLSIKYDIGRDFPSYGLKYIEKHLNLVNENRIEWDFKKYKTNDYQNWPDEIWKDFIKYCEDDGDSPIKMIEIMLPPFFYLCQSVPKTLQQIINEASGSQLDSLMIRSYFQDGYSQPKTSNKVEFEGAISMGVPGVYEDVIKVDVASLYPSIMIEYDIYDRRKDPNKNMLYMLEYFRDERLNNKKLTKETGEKYYDDMQAAQKIMINSMYGFMGAGYLLYNYPKGAAKVTEKGRDILLKGVEWATGHTLEKVVKSIKNKGKDNEEKKYHWIIGDTVNAPSKNFKLVNVDTDSFSVSPGYRVDDKEYKDLVNELNSLYPDMIVWEDDGLFDKVIVVRAKNYVLKTGDKIKYKGSSLTDQKKEPKLIQFLNDVIYVIINDSYDDIKDIFKEYCKEALNPKDIKDWTVKKTITKSVLNPERANEEKVLDACNEAIKLGVISNIQEGDKVWLYQAIDGMKQKMAKGEPVFLKDGSPKMVKNTILKFPELYDEDHDAWHYVERVYKTLDILNSVLDMSQFEKYHLKSKRKLLCQ